MTFNQTYQFFTDPDNDSITLTFANGPAGLTFSDNGNGEGSIVGTPTAGSSPWTVDVTANDGTISVMQQFTLVCNAGGGGGTNSAPVASSFGNQSHQSGNAQSYNISTCFSDPDGDTLTYSVVSPATLPAGITFNTATGVLSFSSSVASGTYSFEVSANDGQDDSNPNCMFDIEVNGISSVANGVGFCDIDQALPEPDNWCGVGNIPNTSIFLGSPLSGSVCGVGITRILMNSNSPTRLYLTFTAPIPAGMSITVGGNTFDLSDFAGQSSFSLSRDATISQDTLNGSFTVTGSC